MPVCDGTGTPRSALHAAMPLISGEVRIAGRNDINEETRRSNIYDSSGDRRRWIDVQYHGRLNFYGSAGEEWFEYNAKFTDGFLVKIERDMQHTKNWRLP